jgi:hypothetical protein
MALYQMNDLRYWQFYRDRVKKGDLVFLDCGAYEGAPFSVDKYIERIQDLEPSVVVIPDLLENSDSYEYSMGMYRYIRSRIDPSIEFMFVPQGFKCKLPDVNAGIQWIGLPRNMVKDHPLARVREAYHLKKFFPDIKIHALGYGGSIHELYYLAQAGVHSWDSSAPVWRGWNGFRIEHETSWQTYHKPVDFNAPISDNHPDGEIRMNLEACGICLPK